MMLITSWAPAGVNNHLVLWKVKGLLCCNLMHDLSFSTNPVCESEQSHLHCFPSAKNLAFLSTLYEWQWFRGLNVNFIESWSMSGEPTRNPILNALQRKCFPSDERPQSLQEIFKKRQARKHTLRTQSSGMSTQKDVPLSSMKNVLYGIIKTVSMLCVAAPFWAATKDNEQHPACSNS